MEYGISLSHLEHQSSVDFFVKLIPKWAIHRLKITNSCINIFFLYSFVQTKKTFEIVRPDKIFSTLDFQWATLYTYHFTKGNAVMFAVCPFATIQSFVKGLRGNRQRPIGQIFLFVQFQTCKIYGIQQLNRRIILLSFLCHFPFLEKNLRGIMLNTRILFGGYSACCSVCVCVCVSVCVCVWRCIGVWFYVHQNTANDPTQLFIRFTKISYMGHWEPRIFAHFNRFM